MMVSTLPVQRNYKDDTYFCILASLWTGRATLGVVRRPPSPFWLTRTAGRSALAREDMVCGRGGYGWRADNGSKASNWIVTKITGVRVAQNASTVRGGFEEKKEPSRRLAVGDGVNGLKPRITIRSHPAFQCPPRAHPCSPEAPGRRGAVRLVRHGENWSPGKRPRVILNAACEESD